MKPCQVEGCNKPSTHEEYPDDDQGPAHLCDEHRNYFL